MVYRICEEMEQAEARRLQPHYIESFFQEAFQGLGESAKQRKQDFGVTSVNYDFTELLERAEVMGDSRGDAEPRRKE